MSAATVPESLPGWKKVVFATGQFGWSLAGFAASALLNYFYFPPETAQGAVFKPFVFQGAILGLLTVVGVANGLGRIFDAFSDPWIAGWSDRLHHAFGRRRIFMAVAAVPTAGLSVLVFSPPIDGVSSANAVWLVATVLLFYLALTAYTIPYTALVAELGHTSKDRLFLSTLVSVGWALGFFVGNSAYALKDLVMGFGPGPEAALRIVVAGFAVVGLVAMLLPVVLIDENRYVHRGHSDEKPLQAILNTLKNPDFRLFLASFCAYYVASTLLEAGIIFYVTILMEMPESMAFTLMAVMFVLSFALYPLVLRLAAAFDKRRVLIAGYTFQMVVFLLIFACGFLDGTVAKVLGWSAILVQAIPSAIAGILPTAMVSDIARADAVRTGSHKAAAFFAGSCFAMKVAVSLGNFILPSCLLLGKSVDNPMGVMLAAIFAAALMAVSVPLLWRYDESRIAIWLEREEAPPP